jgi:hypothetical protein
MFIRALKHLSSQFRSTASYDVSDYTAMAGEYFLPILIKIQVAVLRKNIGYF